MIVEHSRYRVCFASSLLIGCTSSLNGGCFNSHPLYLFRLILIFLIILCMETTSKPEGKKQLGSIFKWIVGVFLVIGGLSFFSNSFLSGLFLVIAGLLIIPAISKKLKVKFSFWEKQPIRIIVPIV